MTKVNILSGDIIKYKTRSFLAPILRYRKELKKEEIDVKIIYDEEDIEDCDFLFVSDRYFLENGSDNLIKKLQNFRQHSNQIYWFDTTDGATVHFYGDFPDNKREIISTVDKYYKKQLLKDKSQYLKPLYGQSPHTEFHNSKSLNHSSKFDNQPQIKSEKDLEKLEVYWNVGQNIYLPYDDIIASTVYPKIFNFSNTVGSKIPWNLILKRSFIWSSPSKERPIDITGRFKTEYELKPIEQHRKNIQEKIQNRIETDRTDTRQYWKELRDAKILVSPFGWGEICHRDFEGFMSGCIVLKPEMDHIETWPPFYEENETIVTFEWNAENLEQKIDEILENYEEYIQIAEKGQKRYKEYLTGEKGKEEFVKKFKAILDN